MRVISNFSSNTLSFLSSYHSYLYTGLFESSTDEITGLCTLYGSDMGCVFCFVFVSFFEMDLQQKTK